MVHHDKDLQCNSTKLYSEVRLKVFCGTSFQKSMQSPKAFKYCITFPMLYLLYYKTKHYILTILLVSAEKEGCHNRKYLMQLWTQHLQPSANGNPSVSWILKCIIPMLDRIGETTELKFPLDKKKYHVLWPHMKHIGTVLLTISGKGYCR